VSADSSSLNALFLLELPTLYSSEGGLTSLEVVHLQPVGHDWRGQHPSSLGWCRSRRTHDRLIRWSHRRTRSRSNGFVL
jgi:hypothetical protein